MTFSSIMAVVAFWIMQIISQLFFKWGSTLDSRWLWGFLCGNVFGFSSIYFLMMVYKTMNPNIAFGICAGGAFLLAQLALSLVFKSEVSILQWGGVVVIVVGMLLLAAGKPLA
ncbi:MAG: hypothetical protein HYS23_00010 [Geobacter sp.]|nr:hypothetical protein [Geobacter sp.]